MEIKSNWINLKKYYKHMHQFSRGQSLENNTFVYSQFNKYLRQYKYININVVTILFITMVAYFCIKLFICRLGKDRQIL